MKVFISQPMKGKTKEQIVHDRNEIIELLESSGHIALISIIADAYPESIEKRIWYLGQEIAILSQADAVYFMDGWKESSGCKIEHAIVKEYEIEILHD